MAITDRRIGTQLYGGKAPTKYTVAKGGISDAQKATRAAREARLAAERRAAELTAKNLRQQQEEEARRAADVVARRAAELTGRQARISTAPAQQIVAEVGDTFGSLAQKARVEEIDFIQANQDVTTIKADAVYNVPDFIKEAPGYPGLVDTLEGVSAFGGQLGYQAGRFMAGAKAGATALLSGGGHERAAAEEAMQDFPDYGTWVDEDDRLNTVERWMGEQPVDPFARTARELELQAKRYQSGAAPEKELRKIPLPPSPSAFEAVNWLTGAGLTGTALHMAGRQLRLDRPEYWDATGSRADILEGMEKFLIAEFGLPNGEIDWEAAIAQDPHIGETLRKLGIHGVPSGDLGDYYSEGVYAGKYSYPTPSYSSGYGGGYGGAGGGYAPSPSVGLVSWSI